MNTRILEGRNAVVFGAAGSIGAAVAKEFAAEGAQVILAGRSKVNLETVANRITQGGGRARVAVIDTLDNATVSHFNGRGREGNREN